MKSSEDIAFQLKKHKGITDRGLSNQWDNTRTCQAFYAGDYMNYGGMITATDLRGNRRKTSVQFNLVKPYVNAVRGFMAQNRRNADYVARMEQDQLQEMYSEWTNAYKDYVRDNANADQVETQQDGDLLICGYGAVETAMTYGDGYSARNPNGEIVMGRLDPRALGWDPSARASNLLDARWVFYKKIYALDEALDLFTDASPDDFEGEQGLDESNKIYYPRGGIYNKIQEIYDWESESEELVKVYFYQWYEVEPFYRAKNPLKDIQDPQTQQYFDLELQALAADQDQDDEYAFDPRADIISCDSKTKKAIEEMFEDGVDFETFRRRVYYTAIVSGKKVFKKYRSPCQSGFTVKFKTGDFDEENKMWVGMVNSLKDPALYYNKALTELMFTIASQAKGGVYIERDAVEDITDFEAKYAKTDAVIVVNDGAISGGKIMPKKEQFTANGLDSVMQMSSDALPMVSGIDKSFLGSSENKLEPAALQRQRVKQVTTALATFFDNITVYQKEQASLLLPMMRIMAENNDGSMFKAISKDGTNIFLKMSPDNFADEYDITIQEAPDTATQREEKSEQLVSMAQMLFAANDPINGKACLAINVKYMGIDFEDQQDLLKTLAPPPTQPIDPAYVQQLEQQLQQAQGQHAQADLRKTMSEAALNMVKGEDLIAGIKKKRSEVRETDAQANQTNVETHILQHKPAESVRVDA